MPNYTAAAQAVTASNYNGGTFTSGLTVTANGVEGEITGACYDVPSTVDTMFFLAFGSNFNTGGIPSNGTVSSVAAGGQIVGPGDRFMLCGPSPGGNSYGANPRGTPAYRVSSTEFLCMLPAGTQLANVTTGNDYSSGATIDCTVGSSWLGRIVPGNNIVQSTSGELITENQLRSSEFGILWCLGFVNAGVYRVFYAQAVYTYALDVMGVELSSSISGVGSITGALTFISPEISSDLDEFDMLGELRGVGQISGTLYAMNNPTDGIDISNPFMERGFFRDFLPVNFEDNELGRECEVSHHWNPGQHLVRGGPMLTGSKYAFGESPDDDDPWMDRL